MRVQRASLPLAAVVATSWLHRVPGSIADVSDMLRVHYDTIEWLALGADSDASIRITPAFQLIVAGLRALAVTTIPYAWSISRKLMIGAKMAANSLSFNVMARIL